MTHQRHIPSKIKLLIFNQLLGGGGKRLISNRDIKIFTAIPFDRKQWMFAVDCFL